MTPVLILLIVGNRIWKLVKSLLRGTCVQTCYHNHISSYEIKRLHKNFVIVEVKEMPISEETVTRL